MTSINVAGVFILISILEFVGLTMAKDAIREYKSEVSSYRAQIDVLRNDSLEQAERFDDARKQADDQMRRIQDENKKILNAKVPKDCNKAVQWALNEAHNFS
jgi:F0F1-type ATP synthase membrane subunit b/b'